MNLGPFLPLRRLFEQTLTEEVFPNLDVDLQRRVILLAGQVDLEDERLLNLFTTFLASDFHKMHRLLIEMLVFNQTKTSSRHRRDVVVLLTALAAKRSYGEINDRIEERLASYYIRDESRLVELRTFVARQRCEGNRAVMVEHLDSLLRG